MVDNTKRATFGGRLSAVLVSAGGAVGLGNIWRFPYVAGQNGGGAFLVIYIICAILIGLPIMLAEFSIGRHSKSNPVGTFRMLNRRWRYFGYNCIFTSFLILGFYSVVSGWTIEYTVHSLTGDIANYASAQEHEAFFNAFVSDPWKPILYTVIATLLTHTVITLGVRKGIERCSKVLMPVLFIMLIILAVRSLMMPGGQQGMEFFLKPDFSKVTAQTFLDAIGQAFFSLSIGLGTMTTYASYFKSETNLSRTAVQVSIIDTLVAILAGLVIFPAVFSAGIEPSAGSKLVFITLPEIFAAMPLSMVWSTLFFMLLAVAAITSVISLHEVVTVYVAEEWHMSRKAATRCTTLGIISLGALASLSLGVLKNWTIFKLTIFDALDFVTANIMLPLGGMCISIFVGWVIKRSIFHNEMTNYDTLRSPLEVPTRLLLRYVCPIMVALIFLDNLGLLKWIG